MFKTSFDRSPLVITARLVLLLIVLLVVVLPLGAGAKALLDLRLGDRTPALPGPPTARMEPRPTPHAPVLGSIPALQGKVTGIWFYQVRPKTAPQTEDYGSRFVKKPDHLVYWVIYMEFPPAAQETELTFDYTFYKSGRIIDTDHYTTSVAKDQAGIQVYYGRDYPPGQYYIEIRHEGQLIANGGVEMVEGGD